MYHLLEVFACGLGGGSSLVGVGWGAVWSVEYSVHEVCIFRWVVQIDPIDHLSVVVDLFELLRGYWTRLTNPANICFRFHYLIMLHL